MITKFAFVMCIGSTCPLLPSYAAAAMVCGSIRDSASVSSLSHSLQPAHVIPFPAAAVIQPLCYSYSPWSGPGTRLRCPRCITTFRSASSSSGTHSIPKEPRKMNQRERERTKLLLNENDCSDQKICMEAIGRSEIIDWRSGSQVQEKQS